MAEFPRDWEHVSVKSLMDLQCGFPFKSTFFNSKGNGIRIVKNRDLKTDDQVFFTTEQVSDEYIIRDGDILIGMDGDFLPCRWKKGIALLNQRVGRLIVTKRIDRDFAYYVLQEPLDELQQATSATTVKHLSPSAFGNLFVTVPSEVAEQHRIADALGSIDKLIDNLTRRIEKKRLVKQGVMQELLTGKKRLPGCKGKWRNITIKNRGGIHPHNSQAGQVFRH